MVASKRILCVICNKRCSGNVLRYQHNYYHKQCFELEQSGLSPQPLASQTTSSPHSHSAKSSSQDLNESPARLAPSMGMQEPSTQTNMDQLPGQLNGLGRHTLDNKKRSAGSSAVTPTTNSSGSKQRSATLPNSNSKSANGFHPDQAAGCAACYQRIQEGQGLIALERNWHLWCFKCSQCQVALHSEYVAKDGKAYCEKDYQRLFGIVCAHCKRYITGKVLQAGQAHNFHPSCARCSKCGDPFVPGEEMYLQGEVTWHPRCGPGPGDGPGASNPVDELDSGPAGGRNSQLRSSRAQSPSLSSRSLSRSASPFSYLSRQYGRASPGYADSEAVGDLSRVYTISYLNADPNQGYLRRPLEPKPPKSPQFSRPASLSRHHVPNEVRSQSSSRSQLQYTGSVGRDRSVPRGLYSVLSGSGGSSRGAQVRARSPTMQNEEAIQLAQYPSAQRPEPDALARIERDDFPAPPFPASTRPRSQERRSRAKSRDLGSASNTAARRADTDGLNMDSTSLSSREGSSEPVADQQLCKEEEELSKIANGIGKIFLKTLRERERLRAWKRSNLDPRNASRTPSATRELPSRPLRYENPASASPSRDSQRPRSWEEELELSTAGSSGLATATLTRGSRANSQMSPSVYGYKVVQSNRSTPKPGYGLQPTPIGSEVTGSGKLPSSISNMGSLSGSRGPQMLAHMRRSMPNVNAFVGTNNYQHRHLDGPPKLYPYHLLSTSNYRLPPDVDRCHLERHLADEEFQYIFHCDRLDFYRLPEWKRNELKRRAKLF